MVNKIVLTVLVVLFGFFVKAQTGSMIITNTQTKPDSMSILEVKSDDKGALLPRMTYDQMQSVDNPKDGLSVYVTGQVNEGIWFWDGKQAIWTRLETVDPFAQSVVEPLQTIVMYMGDLSLFDATGLGLPNTKVQGWALCNGQNGTADLSKKFIVGKGQDSQATSSTTEEFPDYTYKSSSVESDSFKFNEGNIPYHTHTIKNEGNSVTIDHKHKIADPGHGHTVDAIQRKGTKAKGYVPIPVNYNRHHNGPFVFNPSLDEIIVKSPKNTNITYTFPTDLVGCNGGVETDGVDPCQREVKGFDNRPPFIVVAFITKLFY